MTTTADVAVIGLGAMGSAALYELAKRGVRALGIEQFEPGHDRGSSHGESRIIRLSYFKHPSYVPLLRRAYAKWRALEADCGETILTVTGILEAGYPGSTLVQGSLLASREHALSHETLTAAEVARRYPAFRLPEDWSAMFQPDGGFLRPERAIASFVSRAKAHGASVWTQARVGVVRASPSCLILETDRGVVEAGRVIVATGPWIGALAPELKPHLTLTRQVLGWFAAPDPALVSLDRFPVFALQSEADTWYGFPDFAGTGVKAASHIMGETLDAADALRQDGNEQDEAQIRAGLQYIPAANGSLARMRTCIYTRTPDDFFMIDRAVADPRIVIASPCSGHGFKFASVIGEILTELALDGRTQHDISRFRADRFTTRP